MNYICLLTLERGRLPLLQFDLTCIDKGALPVSCVLCALCRYYLNSFYAIIRTGRSWFNSLVIHLYLLFLFLFLMLFTCFLYSFGYFFSLWNILCPFAILFTYAAGFFLLVSSSYAKVYDFYRSFNC